MVRDRYYNELLKLVNKDKDIINKQDAANALTDIVIYFTNQVSAFRNDGYDYEEFTTKLKKEMNSPMMYDNIWGIIESRYIGMTRFDVARKVDEFIKDVEKMCGYLIEMSQTKPFQKVVNPDFNFIEFFVLLDEYLRVSRPSYIETVIYNK